MPGEILWPENGFPKLVFAGSCANGGWHEFLVGWPPGRKRQFLAGQEQFSDWPDSNPFCFDDGEGATNGNHTWFRYDGAWSSFEAPNNLMLRVVVDSGGAVSPTSLGRIKGLYR